MKRLIVLCITASLSLTFCVTVPTLSMRIDASKPSTDALRAGQFEKSLELANGVIKADAGNQFSYLARAIARYVIAGRRLFSEGRQVWERSRKNRSLEIDYFRKALIKADNELALVDADLEKASSSKDVHLNLGPALWEFDWDLDGYTNDWDKALLEIELDEKGNELPKDDPKRRPVYRFDQGDVYWAQAFVNFQRSIFSVILAYEWEVANSLLNKPFSENQEIRIKLINKALIKKARELALKGLDCADRARLSYLAETDDEREWIPNPRQKNHPIPLPVTEELYKTWEGVLADLKKLLNGDEGISVRDIAELATIRMKSAPRGYIDIGRMFDHPKDIVINLAELSIFEKTNNIESFLKSFFGEYYVYDKKASLLTWRLWRMRREINAGVEPLGRKLRYLFWLN